MTILLQLVLGFFLLGIPLGGLAPAHADTAMKSSRQVTEVRRTIDKLKLPDGKI